MRCEPDSLAPWIGGALDGPALCPHFFFVGSGKICEAGACVDPATQARADVTARAMPVKPA